MKKKDTERLCQYAYQISPMYKIPEKELNLRVTKPHGHAILRKSDPSPFSALRESAVLAFQVCMYLVGLALRS